MAGTRRLRNNRLALPILLRVPIQRVTQRKATAGTYRCWVSLAFGSWVAIVLRSKHGEVSEANMHASPLPVITDEIKIVDSQGHPRIIMSARSGNPVIQLLETNGAIGMEVLLDSTGRPAVKLANPTRKVPRQCSRWTTRVPMCCSIVRVGHLAISSSTMPVHRGSYLSTRTACDV